MALRLLRGRHRLLDGLSANAYGIYLVHYVFVVWLQYALIGTALSAYVKVCVVFAAALALSWLTSASGKAFGRTAARALLRGPATVPPKGAIADQTP